MVKRFEWSIGQETNKPSYISDKIVWSVEKYQDSSFVNGLNRDSEKDSCFTDKTIASFGKNSDAHRGSVQERHRTTRADNARERRNARGGNCRIRRDRVSRGDSPRDRRNTRHGHSLGRRKTELSHFQKSRENRNSRHDYSKRRNNTIVSHEDDFRNTRYVGLHQGQKYTERENNHDSFLKRYSSRESQISSPCRDNNRVRRNRDTRHASVMHDRNSQRHNKLSGRIAKLQDHKIDELGMNYKINSRKRRCAMEPLKVTLHKKQRTICHRRDAESVQGLDISSRQAVGTYLSEIYVRRTTRVRETHTRSKTLYSDINCIRQHRSFGLRSRDSPEDEEYLRSVTETRSGKRGTNSISDSEDSDVVYTGFDRGSNSLTGYSGHRLISANSSDSETDNEPFNITQPCHGNSILKHVKDICPGNTDDNSSFTLYGHGNQVKGQSSYRSSFNESDTGDNTMPLFRCGLAQSFVWQIKEGIRNRFNLETSTEGREETVWKSDDIGSSNSEDASDFDVEAVMAGRKNLNKNAISAFEEYGVQHRQTPKVEVISSNGPAHKPLFIAVARLGNEEICSEKGHSKHEARIKAAERALQMLSVQDVGATADTEPSESQPPESSDEDISNPVPYKDPVSALMEFAQFAKLEVSFDLISQEGPPHMPIFTMAVKLGDDICQSVKGGSAKETKKRAACLALNQLKKDGALQTLFPDTKASSVPVGKLKSKLTLGAPGKNPASVLNEYAQKSSKRLTFESSQTGPPHKPVFTVWAVLGEERFPTVTSANRKEGKVLAADTALKKLGERGLYVMPKAILGQPTPTNNTTCIPLTHHDRVAAAALRKFDELLLQTPESLVGRKVIAAIVMMDTDKDLYRVISLGSGNRCVKGSHISHDGTVLHDSHAEVLARRGFKRFLYWLHRTKDLPILVPSRQGKQKFKDGISFHLYISTAPCGDGALFTHSDRGVEGSSCRGSEHHPVFSNTRTQGLLRAKQENGEGTIPVEQEFVGQTYDGIQQGGRLRVMSCSDKICQWNVLGLQGALLSGLYEPVYLRSITLGNLFNAGHLARAVCCRIDYSSAPLQSRLPSGYHVNHPDLGVTSFQDATRVVEKARSLSINWCFGDKVPEITDGTIGKTVKTVDKTVGPSRLCKKSLFELYRHMSGKELFTDVSYKRTKLEADEYNQAKMALHGRLEERYGYWVCMPREVDRF